MSGFRSLVRIAVGVATACTSAAALAATAPLQAPSRNGAMRALESHEVAFSLSDAFTRYRSVSRGAVMRGTYRREVRASTYTCVILLRALGRLERRRPSLGRAAAPWGLRARFAVTARGRFGPLRWYVGRASGLPTAFAWRKAPHAVSSRNPYLAVYMQVDQQQHGFQGCFEAINQQREELRRAIRSAHPRRR